MNIGHRSPFIRLFPLSSGFQESRVLCSTVTGCDLKRREARMATDKGLAPIELVQSKIIVLRSHLTSCSG